MLATTGTVGTALAFPQANGSVVFPDSACGNSQGQRVLVAYASQFGTTGEIAEAMAGRFCLAGMSADTKRVRDVQDLADYDAVIIGAAIHYDNWMAEARHFVTGNEDTLSRIPVAYFFTCGTLADSSDKAIAKSDEYADKIASVSDRVTPLSIGRFAGVLDYSRMNLRTRIGLWPFFTVIGANEGDYRDWAAINDWTDNTIAPPPFTTT